MRVRLDKLLVERGLVETRMRAQERIAAGHVRIDGTLCLRASAPVDPSSAVELSGEPPPYVGRGGIKLAAALEHWQIELAGRICLDVGISTGGFTDCMLQRQAAEVIGVDSGHSQLHASLRSDPRVRVLERTNARYLEASMLPTGIRFLAIDVSFIAASLVLPAVVRAAFQRPSTDASESERTPGEAVILVKPQFEAGRDFVGPRGLVTSEKAHRLAIDRVASAALAVGAESSAVIESPITGGDGNREFLLYARFQREPACR